MLLVTFHGGKSPGINNVFTYADNGTLLSQTGLSVPSAVTLSELRAMAVANGSLYVANGAKSQSQVLCFAMPAVKNQFNWQATVVGPTMDGKHFQTSIAHPFDIAFDGAYTCYISNQDTNVVAQIGLSANGRNGTLPKGCQSAYLNNDTGLGAKPVFLDGTFVASQNGKLHDIGITATDVPAASGGLQLKLDASKKVQNSVRGVGAANGILLVCNESECVINLYSLADGSYLGSTQPLPAGPTHLTINNGGVYVSAGPTLYWGTLPTTVNGALSGPMLSLAPVTLTPAAPAGNKIGGISFGPAATVYIPFQPGTGGANGGSIYTYTVAQSSSSAVPAFTSGTQFVASGPNTFADTPEFVLYIPG